MNINSSNNTNKISNSSSSSNIDNTTIYNVLLTLSNQLAEHNDLLRQLQKQLSEQFVCNSNQNHSYSLEQQNAINHKNKVAEVIAEPNCRGPRDLKANLTLHKDQYGQNAVLSDEQINIKRLVLRHLARQMRHKMANDGIKATKWSQVANDDQLYYELKLEEEATESGINIYRCRQQWCAKLLLQETYKTHTEIRKRRRQQQAVSDSNNHNMIKEEPSSPKLL
ncbi:uncharacterized protein BX663DRAFT_259618 [Cokeromyces recurvatus]|uniref:uncharacterized protein n=1 Tax=Cokeromyces recurvatus TaxID=90255 RepID=UPI0022200331|nr:uncharacterized protein BX663DRAFT_259618 [Cokeromyces recurvatus]KAI7898482.1 hypothetical protein BX663DRAFT_259618 [Cokeromyces recurvatus]